MAKTKMVAPFYYYKFCGFAGSVAVCFSNFIGFSIIKSINIEI
jgi:hypothetical protein